MSVICDCLIYTGLGDSEHAIRAVNADERLRGFGFRKLDTETAGGGKVFCGEVWAGAFNHTMPRDLLDAIAKAPWTYPEETIVGRGRLRLRHPRLLDNGCQDQGD